MNFRRNKSEITGILFLGILSIILLVINTIDKKHLNEKGVYVIGKLFSSDSRGEIGWVYKYQYRFNSKIYYRSFTGPLPKESKNDSLMFFKVLPEDPEICRQILTPRVPQCLTFLTAPKGGWKILPLSACR